MKKIFLAFIAILCFNVGLLQAEDGIEFFHGTFEEAKAAAKAQGKLIFMDAYAVWCGPCKQMTNNVFPQKSVGDYFNKNFINMKVDMEQGEGLTLRSTYGVTAYPTLMFIDHTGTLVQQVRGARSAESLLEWAKSVSLPNAGAIQLLEEKYKEGDRSIGLLKELVNVKASSKEDFSIYFEALLASMSKEELLTPENAEFIFDNTTSINSPGLEVISSNKEFFKDLKGKDSFDKKFLTIASLEAKEATKMKNVTKVYDAIDFLKKYKPTDYKIASSELLVNYYGATKDWVSYDKAATQHLTKYNKVDQGAYKEVAWIYYMNIDDVAKLKKAEKWMQSAIAQNNTYENNLTQAYLLYKLESYSEAEDAVNYALILADGQKRTDNAQILKNQILKKLNKEETPE